MASFSIERLLSLATHPFRHWTAVGLCLVCLVGITFVARPVAAQDASSSSTKNNASMDAVPRSLYALQQEYGRIAEEADRQRRTVTLLEATIAQATALRELAKAVTLDDAAAETIAQTLRTKPASPKKELLTTLQGPAELFVTGLANELDSDTGGRSRQLNRQLLGDFANPSDCIGKLVDGDPGAQKLIANPASATAAGIQELFGKAKALALKQIDGFIARVEAQKRAWMTELAGLKSQLDSLDQQLATSGKQKTEIDRLLIYAVWMMIGGLVVLFWLVRFFPENIQTAIMENRMLVEILSMAFLLLTVIILATGKQLQSEAVGTLLGTVAGYIFGRTHPPAKPNP